MFGCVQNDGYDVMGILRVSAEENKVNRSFLRTFVQFILALDRYVELVFVYLWVTDPSRVIVFHPKLNCLHYLLRCLSLLLWFVLSYATSD